MSNTKTNAKTNETTQTETAGFDVKKGFVDLKTKSALIRHMASLPEFRKNEGKDVDIGKINKGFETAGIKMRYQHVRNVLNQPLKTKTA